MKSRQNKIEADEAKASENPGFQRIAIITQFPQENASPLLISTLARDSLLSHSLSSSSTSTSQTMRNTLYNHPLFRKIKNPFRRPSQENGNPFRFPRG